jgi:hypothetical protein
MSQDIGQKWIVKDRGYNEISIEAEDCFNAICFFNDANSIDKNKVNAAYIVKTVNNYEPLLESLEQLIKFYKNTQGLDLPELESLIKKARDL